MINVDPYKSLSIGCCSDAEGTGAADSNAATEEDKSPDGEHVNSGQDTEVTTFFWLEIYDL